MLEMQAAIGRIQLRRMAEWTRARTANATILQDALTPFAGRDGIIRLGGPLGQDASWPEGRSEEHTPELQSLMRISYAVFCLKKKKIHKEKYEDTAVCTKTNTQLVLYRRINKQHSNSYTHQHYND